MGLTFYTCDADTPVTLPSLLGRHGFSVESEPDRVALMEKEFSLADAEKEFGQAYAYRLRRGWATVQVTGYAEEDAAPVFTVVCGSNPLLWSADMRLFREVEAVLLAHGFQVRGLPQ